MQVTLEDQSPVKKTLHVEIPEETVTQQLDDSYRQLKKNAKVKGFRPGKAPVSMLKRMYKDKVHADVAYQLIQESLPQAVKEKELAIVGEPEIDPSELKEAEPFTYAATVEVKPELADIDFKGLSLTKNRYQVSEQEIQNQLDMLRRNLARDEDVAEERPAAEGDVAIISYQGFQNGEPSESFPETDDYRLKLGSGHISEAFDNHIIGISPGESKEFDITFPDDYPNKKVAGQTVSFHVTLKDLKQEILPEIDDEMAAQLGPFESLEQLRQEIIKNLQSGYDKRGEQEINEQVFEALLEQCQFEVPETLIQHELQSILDEIKRTYEHYNLSLEGMGQTEESLKEQYRETAVKQAQRHIILNKIAEQENLTITEEQIEESFQEMAEAMGQPVAMVKQFYQQQPDQIEVLRYSLLEKNALQTIIDHSHIEEKELEQVREEDNEETN